MTPEQATEQLFKAAQTGNVDDARTAIDARADLNATNEFARTARDLARAFGHPEIVNMIDAATQQSRHPDRQRTNEPRTGRGV
jgi:ankyrin repeat protein